MKEKKSINIEIGQNIRYYRDAAGLTQETLAEMMGRGVKHVSAMERGAVGVSISTLKQISESLSIPVDFLIFGQPEIIKKQEREAEIQLLAIRLSRLSPRKYRVVKEIMNKLLEALAVDKE